MKREHIPYMRDLGDEGIVDGFHERNFIRTKFRHVTQH